MEKNNTKGTTNDPTSSLDELGVVQSSRITEQRLLVLRDQEVELKRRHQTARVLLEFAESQARVDAEARMRERQIFMEIEHRRHGDAEDRSET